MDGYDKLLPSPTPNSQPYWDGLNEGRLRLQRYYERYLAVARARGTGFVLDSATWRASADWGDRLGYDADRLAAVNRAAIDMLVDLRQRWETPRTPCVISGALGPRGDGYKGGTMDAAAAEAYHAAQIATFAYFGRMHFSFDEDCDVILRQDTQDFGEPSSMSNFVWKLVWEGRRVADRDERFRLYVRIDRPKPPVKRRNSRPKPG